MPWLKDATLVFGEGPVPCRLMVVGEAPGRDETRLGHPFAGKAGSFFVKILLEAGMDRKDVYITNVLKSWPYIPTKRFKTRPPKDFEEAFFLPFLMEEIRCVDPAVIIAVGKTAMRALCPGADFTPGKWSITDEGREVMPVFHPAYILRRGKSLDGSSRELKSYLMEARKRAF